MRKIKQYKKWGIYQITEKEKKNGCSFNIAVIPPDLMECPFPHLEPTDTDIELDTVEDAMLWIDNY